MKLEWLLPEITSTRSLQKEKLSTLFRCGGFVNYMFFVLYLHLYVFQTSFEIPNTVNYQVQVAISLKRVWGLRGSSLWIMSLSANRWLFVQTTSFSILGKHGQVSAANSKRADVLTCRVQMRRRSDEHSYHESISSNTKQISFTCAFRSLGIQPAKCSWHLQMFRPDVGICMCSWTARRIG